MSKKKGATFIYYVITNTVLLIVVSVGFIIGTMYECECPVRIEPQCNESMTFYKLNGSDYQWINMCCYPSDCPQAKNNPEQCTCIYMVECYQGDEYGRPNYDKFGFEQKWQKRLNT